MVISEWSKDNYLNASGNNGPRKLLRSISSNASKQPSGRDLRLHNSCTIAAQQGYLPPNAGRTPERKSLIPNARINLLNRNRGQNLYRGFESLPLRRISLSLIQRKVLQAVVPRNSYITSELFGTRGAQLACTNRLQGLHRCSPSSPRCSFA